MKNVTVQGLEEKFVKLLSGIQITDRAQLIEVFDKLDEEETKLFWQLQTTLGMQEFAIWLSRLIERAGKTQELVTASSAGMAEKEAEVREKMRRAQAKLDRVMRLQAELDALDEEDDSEARQLDRELDRMMEITARSPGLKN